MLLVVADIDKQLVQIFLPTRISVESKLPVIYFQPNSELRLDGTEMKENKH